MRARVTVVLSVLLLCSSSLLAQSNDESIRERLMKQAQAQSEKGAVATVEIEGQSLEVYSWSWGVSQVPVVGGGGGGAGKVSFQDLHFVSKVSKASPVLFQACATGKHFPSVIITARNDKGQTYLVLKLEDCLITSYNTGGSSGDSVPTESLSISFAKVDYRILIGL